MDYLYLKVEDAYFRKDTALRKAFDDHLRKVAAALRAIEWNDSGDGDCTEDEKIRACLAPGAEIEAAIESAMAARDELTAAIKRARP